MNKDYEELFVTCVGSHVWGMETPESDIDLFKCYIAPSEDFLIGKQHRGGHQSIVNDVDTQSAEIGTTIEQILKNNLNYLIYVLSPITVKTGWEQEELKKLTVLNLSKNCYYSIHGMAIHNYKKYVEKGKGDTQKRRRTIMRVLQFGITLLEKGEISFEPILWDVENQDIIDAINALDIVYKDSILPEKPQNEKEIYEYLLKLRLAKLEKYYEF